METLKGKAHAKINLTLDIVGESRGFHLLDMLVSDIELCDEVTVRERADGKAECIMDGVPQDERNSALRAVNLMRRVFKTPYFDVEIEKHIPMSGGLGGSTADGVAVIRLIAEILDIPRKKITSEFLLELGSDAPCMYDSGTKRVRETGGKVDLIDVVWPYNIGFIAGGGVDTAKAYALFDSMRLKGGRATERLLKAMEKESYDISKYLSNDLFIPAARLNPSVSEAYGRLKASDALAVNMSGSGSTVYGLWRGEPPRDTVFTRFMR